MNLSRRIVSLLLIVALVFSFATMSFATGEYEAAENDEIAKSINKVLKKVIGIMLAIINPLCVACVIGGAICLALGVFDERKTSIAKKAIITAIIVVILANSASAIVNWGTSAL